jgi:hypothetical protein
MYIYLAASGLYCSKGRVCFKSYTIGMFLCILVLWTQVAPYVRFNNVVNLDVGISVFKEVYMGRVFSIYTYSLRVTEVIGLWRSRSDIIAHK